MEIDHYVVLGSPSGEEGAKLDEKDISRAYKLKALALHPDKRPNNPNAHENFRRLKSSYQTLKDKKTRKDFDDLLHVKRYHQQRRHVCSRSKQDDGKQQKMVAELLKMERAEFAAAKAKEKEERNDREAQEVVARFRAKLVAKKRVAAAAAPSPPPPPAASMQVEKERVMSSRDKEMFLNARKSSAAFQECEAAILDKLQKAASART